MTFNEKYLPEYIAVAEQQRCRIYEYKEKPIRCKQYLEYNHSAKRSEKTVSVCGRCAQIGRKCYHCEGDHHVGDRQCPEQRKHEKILAIQAKVRVSRERARIIYNQQRPMKDISYTQVARQERAEQRTKKNDHSNEEGGENTGRDSVTHTHEMSSSRRGIKSGTLLNEKRDKQVKRRKLSEAMEQQNTEVVCVEPITGEMFTTTVQLGYREEVSDDCEGTSECNPVLRSEVKRIYKKMSKQQRPRYSRETHEKQDKRRTRSRSRRTPEKGNEDRSAQTPEIGRINIEADLLGDNNSELRTRMYRSKSIAVMQWNCQGIREKKNEILDLVHHHKPSILGVQETKLWTYCKFTMPNFYVVCADGHFNRTRHGGVALYIHADIPFSERQLQTDIQAIAIQANIRQLVTISAMYICREVRSEAKTV